MFNCINWIPYILKNLLNQKMYFFIAEMPAHGPIITTEKTKYEPGDLLRANCSSAPSKPPAALTFHLNNNPVSFFFKLPKSFYHTNRLEY